MCINKYNYIFAYPPEINVVVIKDFCNNFLSLFESYKTFHHDILVAGIS